MSMMSDFGKGVSVIGYVVMLFVCESSGSEIWQSLLASSAFGIFMLLLTKEK